MPTINLPDDEFAAVIAAIRGVIEDDTFPHAPRLDPLKAALGKLVAASDATHVSRTHRRRARATSGGGANRSAAGGSRVSPAGDDRGGALFLERSFLMPSRILAR
jgi:hypothetical protein